MFTNKLLQRVGRDNTQVLNMNAAVACLPSEMQNPPLQALCREATSTAFKIWRWVLDDVHREMVKCEACKNSTPLDR